MQKLLMSLIGVGWKQSMLLANWIEYRFETSYSKLVIVKCLKNGLQLFK